jgi:hypothetical protein
VSRPNHEATPRQARDRYGALDLDRQEGITTSARELPAGARHGGGGKFVLTDTTRDAAPVREKFQLGDDGRTLPDGSAYQHARAAWYAHEDDLVTDPNGNEYAVLTRAYEYPHPDEDGEYAVTLRSSPWKAGTETGGSYSPFYSYHLTVQPLGEDGEIEWRRTPPRSLSVRLAPQYEGMVYPDGNDLRLPHGEGTLVRVQTTWVEESEELLERSAHLLGHALDYGLQQADLAPDSTGFEKAEVHHRITEEVGSDVAHTIRQSAELLAGHDADVETRGVHENSRWLKAKIRTEGWEKLGFPRLDAPILLKLYYPDNPDAVEYPLDQPKIEVALDGKETVLDESGQTTERMVPWSRWDEIMTILEEILLSHLEWADVSPADLVADDYSDGPQNPRTRFQHPEGRRAWLRNHYENLVPALYREATRTRTDLVLDILDAVRRRGACTYEDLVVETGAAKRTIREHVRRLEEDTGGDGPGILARERGAKTLVAYSSRFLEELGADALDSVQADREELAEDREDRADERTRDHLETLGLSESDAETLVAAVAESRVYTRADLRAVDALADLEAIVDDLGVTVDLTEPSSDDDTHAAEDGESATWTAFDALPLDGEALGYALEDGTVDAEHVRVRTDPYPMLAD